MNVEQFTNKVKELADKKGVVLSGSVKFVFHEGQVSIEGSKVHNADIDADCTVTMGLEDITKMMSGERNIMEIVMSGEMQIEGDMNLVMEVAQILA